VPVHPSFRDPAGQLITIRGRVLRVVLEDPASEVLEILNSDCGREWTANGWLVSSRVLAGDEIQALRTETAFDALVSQHPRAVVLEHERIGFPSYPYEWSPQMLGAAGKLTMRLAQSALQHNFGIKDATPYNILFRGAKPVFVDVLSFEQRTAEDPTWLPYAQFTRTFLLPLLVNKFFRTPLDQVFLTRRDGLEPDDVYPYLSTRQKLLPPALQLITMPVLLARRSERSGDELYKPRKARNPELARFVLESMFRRVERALDRLMTEARQSRWSDYLISNNNYAPEAFTAKERFVAEALSDLAPRRVLDVGCNTGHFSALAARAGASVVSIDYDAAVIDRVWQKAQAENLDILPLVVNLTRPSPPIGWLNAECPSFLDRARGAFDCILMLAVIHHMLVTERVPLRAIIDLAADLTNRHAVIEFIDPADSMFRRLLRGRGELHRDLNATAFENACAEKFDIVRRQQIEGSHRWVYLLLKKG
jgi:SAM-dependent methyltransferase